MNRALIIVAHGSSVNPASTSTVLDAVGELRKRPDVAARFDLVEVRFLKQEPRAERDEWQNHEVVVIPFFMSEGYFVREVLPTRVPERAHITRALGAARLDDIVRAAVAQFEPSAHIVLVGHGTERSETSSDTVHALAGRLRPEARAVVCAFVDEEPHLETTWDRLPDDGAPVVVVPYFAFAGPHTDVDIPGGLGLPNSTAGPHEVRGHAVHYAAPIGAMPEIVNVLAGLALDWRDLDSE